MDQMGFFSRSWKPALSNQSWMLDTELLPVAWLITPWYKGRGLLMRRRRRRKGGSNKAGCKAIKAAVNVDWVSLRSRWKTEECPSMCSLQTQWAHVCTSFISQHVPTRISVHVGLVIWMDVWLLVRMRMNSSGKMTGWRGISGWRWKRTSIIKLYSVAGNTLVFCECMILP